MSPITETAEKSTEQLLSELLDCQKKELRRSRTVSLVNLLLILIWIAALAILLPRALALLDHAQSSLTQIDALAAQAQELVQTTGAVATDANELIRGANKMVTDHADSIAQTVERVKKIDIEGLNEAIKNLNDAVRPLSEFARRFL